jgi:hypothetical protein
LGAPFKPSFGLSGLDVPSLFFLNADRPTADSFTADSFIARAFS